jgi:hypothetical protein
LQAIEQQRDAAAAAAARGEELSLALQEAQVSDGIGAFRSLLRICLQLQIALLQRKLAELETASAAEEEARMAAAEESGTAQLQLRRELQQAVAERDQLIIQANIKII